MNTGVTQPACHQAALLLVEEIATTRAFASITIAGAMNMNYCGVCVCVCARARERVFTRREHDRCDAHGLLRHWI